jgi:TATA-box binding protein (TBP) (component of TFIID and TFIIIB)
MVITGARAKAEFLEAVQFIQDELAAVTVEGG